MEPLINQTTGENITIDLEKINATNTSLIEESVSNPLIIACYSIIIAVSLCGNILVCKVAFDSKNMRTTTNMLIASLACSDIVMTAFNIPFNVARILLLDWPFGSFLCFLVPFIQTACVYVSTFTMTVIALHRLWTVTQKRTSRSFSALKLCLIVFAIWILAGSLSLPHSAFNRLKEVPYNGQTLIRCRVNFPKLNFNFPLFLSVEVFITQYLLPLSVTLVVYIKIGFIISKQGKLIGKLSDEKKRRQSEAKRRRIFMLAMAVVTFATCWLPINTYHLLCDFKVIHHHKNIFLICHWFAMSSVCYNPFIYCWLNNQFREGMKSSIQGIYKFCINTVRTKSSDIHSNETQVSLPLHSRDKDMGNTMVSNLNHCEESPLTLPNSDL